MTPRPNHKRLSATLAVDTSGAYSAGDLLADKVSLSLGTGEHKLKIRNIVLSDLAKQSAAIDLIFFKSDPSNTTFAKNAAFDVADADLPNVAGIVRIAAGDYVGLADNSVACVGESDADSHLPLQLTLDGPTLYIAAVSAGTPTYTAATDLTLIVEAEVLP